MIIERATGKTVTQYLEEKIWKPLGMEAPCSWSIDSVNSGFEKMQSGINARAIDFAKFGRLYLKEGNWNEKQLLPVDWVKASTQSDSKSDLFKDYKYSWWVNEEGFAAEGAFGQYICVFPNHNIIIVRFGIKNDLEDKWEKIFLDIQAELAKEPHRH